MGITAALNSARNAIAIRSTETDLVSRNIAGADKDGYTRKSVELRTFPNGAVSIARVARQSNEALFSSAVRGNADAALQTALLAGVTALQRTVDTSLGDGTPAGRIGALVDAINHAASSPGDQTLAQSAVDKAKSLVQTLHDATDAVQTVRKTADDALTSSVTDINTLLQRFDAVNRRIVLRGSTNGDVTSDLDERDSILTDLSSQIGIRTTQRAGGDMQIYTDSGVTLFDGTARQVSFQSTAVFDATVSGQPLMIDGLPVTGPNAAMPLISGKVVANARLRDDIAVRYQGQLDEIARGLIYAFQETDNTGAAASARAGLFRNGAGYALPGAAHVTGLAASIQLAPTVDKAIGGTPMLLRDGGVSDPLDPAYKWNTTNAASYGDRLKAIFSQLSASQTFDSTLGGVASGTIVAYTSSSTGWIEGLRQSVSADSEQRSAFLQRAQQALSSSTGVSLDQEMSHMLDLERAYQGSAKLMSIVDSMLQSLMEAVR